MNVDKNIVYQNYKITRVERQKLLCQKPLVVWLTGLSGSGKSTIADAVEQRLFQSGFKTYLLDGDNIRHGLNKNIDFSAEGRKENIRRIGEVCKLFADAGIIVITAFVSPFAEDRNMVRNLLTGGEFFEVFVDCPIEICEARDVKGLYKKARAGEIKDFTGIDSPFEPPVNPELILNSNELSVEDSVNMVLKNILTKIKI